MERRGLDRKMGEEGEGIKAQLEANPVLDYDRELVGYSDFN